MCNLSTQINIATQKGFTLIELVIVIVIVGILAAVAIPNFSSTTSDAQVAANKAIGINGAGWWRIKTYTDAQSATRYKTELLVAMDVTAAVAGDAADDSVVADS